MTLRAAARCFLAAVPSSRRIHIEPVVCEIEGCSKAFCERGSLVRHLRVSYSLAALESRQHGSALLTSYSRWWAVLFEWCCMLLQVCVTVRDQKQVSCSFHLSFLSQTAFKDCAKLPPWSAAGLACSHGRRRLALHCWCTRCLPLLMRCGLPRQRQVSFAAYLNDFYGTPLSSAAGVATRGPGCCGGLLSQVSRMQDMATKLRALAAIRRGR